MNNPEKLATKGTQRRRKIKQTHNIVCVGHHYAQANTNYVYKTWVKWWLPKYKINERVGEAIPQESCENVDLEQLPNVIVETLSRVQRDGPSLGICNIKM